MAEPVAPASGDALSVDDIEAAYARALQAVEAVEVALPPEPAGGDALAANAAAAPGSAPGAAPAWDVSGDPARIEHAAGVVSSRESVKAAGTAPAGGIGAAGAAAEEPVLHPRQIVEAVLFVGGEPVTVRRLAQLLGADCSAEDIERLIESLNEQYAEEARPYRATFGEGGYRLTLLEEFEPVRSRVFGTGPKDVRLSQEVLEALAYIAYRQPVRREDLEAAGKENAAVLLRQLLRRGLIELHRDEDDVTYTTTHRFLDVFGLRSLNELPLPEDLEVK